jgi:hypothetical protein
MLRRNLQYDGLRLRGSRTAAWNNTAVEKQYSKIVAQGSSGR